MCLGRLAALTQVALIMLFVCGGVRALGAPPSILDLPEALADPYDLTWTLTVTHSLNAALLLHVEQHRNTGYRLTVTADSICWQEQRGKSIRTLTSATVSLASGRAYALTVKRRHEAIAVLLDHRLVLTAPAPIPIRGRLFLEPLPDAMQVDDLRYQDVGTRIFGDDFMRPEALKRFLQSQSAWVEDDIWQVAYYGKANPGEDPRDPASGKAMRNPWLLSLFPTAETSANGFWFVYTGVGPSRVIATPTQVLPTWDRYSLQAAVKPEYDSEVGLIAAYQDDGNYLLFRWRPREDSPAGKPCAELVAFHDGIPRVLATATRGFAPEQWYTLRLNVGWRLVQALVDGEVLMEAAAHPGPCEGRVGLYALGAPAPRRPRLDQETIAMYQAPDARGRLVSAAAEAMRTESLIYFDDVRVGDWDGAADALGDPTYAATRTGGWTAQATGYTSEAPGRWITGGTGRGRYTLTTQLTLPPGGQGGVLFHVDAGGREGYAWTLSSAGQTLRRFHGARWHAPVDRSATGVPPQTPVTLRLEVDGPYVVAWCNGRRVLEHYDPARVTGRFGVISLAPDVHFAPMRLLQRDREMQPTPSHARFVEDAWASTWADPAAEWYPAILPATHVTPAGAPHHQVGAAAPFPTDQPGRYWRKGGHYGDLRILIPCPPSVLAGQVLHLTVPEAPDDGYRIDLLPKRGRLRVRVWRHTRLIADLRRPAAGADAMLCVERRGAFLLIGLFPDVSDPRTLPATLPASALLLCYRDPHPLPATHVGFTVTSPALPAAALHVQGGQRHDNFEEAPVAWMAQSGVWAVSSRYTCQPKWNWFGGFGAGTPTIWSKYRLDGDQSVEAYMGIKMQVPNAREEYVRRYRDLNMTICGDGAHLTKGYTVIRAGRFDGEVMTVLLRNGEIVCATREIEHLLPRQSTGHRQWFATRIEKRGAEITVYLDNCLAMTYVDPDPLPGGHTALWTLDNGLMIARVTLAAQAITLGAPRAAVALPAPALPPPGVVPAWAAERGPFALTFETGFDGCTSASPRGSFLLRERGATTGREDTTVLTVVNAFPAGDLGVSLWSRPCDLRAMPWLHMTYRCDPGVQLALYVRYQDLWYECPFTGPSSSSPSMVALPPVPAVADGQWRRLSIPIGDILADAVQQRSGTPANELTVQAIVLAEWTTPPALRRYGLGRNPGGVRLQLDDLVLAPTATPPSSAAL